MNTTTAVKEDDLIQSLFDLQIPGMNEDINGYWLLHFFRWITFVRNKVLDLPIIESEKYLDMIGVRIFRDHYKQNGVERLMREDMPELFQRTKDFIALFVQACQRRERSPSPVEPPAKCARLQ